MLPENVHISAVAISKIIKDNLIDLNFIIDLLQTFAQLIDTLLRGHHLLGQGTRVHGGLWGGWGRGPRRVLLWWLSAFGLHDRGELHLLAFSLSQLDQEVTGVFESLNEVRFYTAWVFFWFPSFALWAISNYHFKVFKIKVIKCGIINYETKLFKIWFQNVDDYDYSHWSFNVINFIFLFWYEIFDEFKRGKFLWKFVLGQ